MEVTSPNGGFELEQRLVGHIIGCELCSNLLLHLIDDFSLQIEYISGLVCLVGFGKLFVSTAQSVERETPGLEDFVNKHVLIAKVLDILFHKGYCM